MKGRNSKYLKSIIKSKKHCFYIIVTILLEISGFLHLCCFTLMLLGLQ